MTRLSRWLLSGILVLIPLFGLFAQITDPKYDSGNTYREVIPGLDGCGTVSVPNPMCHYHPGMQTWGNDTPMKEYAYRGRDSAANVLEFMNWRMLFPVGYKWDGSVKYPLIVMLHGAGETGRVGCCGTNWAPNNVKYDNNDHNVLHGGKEHQIACGYSSSTGLPSGTVKWPGVVLWPQSSYNAAWDGGWNGGVLADDGRMVTKIVEWVINNPKYNIDPDRVSMHGLSNGAQGLWGVAAKRPDLFAAILPMSGVATNYDEQTNVLVTTPIWQFQGGKDTNPNPQASLDLFNMLVAKGGNPRYTLYPNLGHGTWTTAYLEPDFYPFMLAANKKKIYVFGGDASLCPGGTLKLGVSAGHAAYQWTLGGADIPGANSRYYNAIAPGTYRVRMTRQPTVLAGATVTSDPVTIVASTGSSFVPTITNTGSLQIPISDGSTPRGGVNNEVKLTAPLGYSTYYWTKNGIETSSASNINIISAGTGGAGDQGTYSVKVLQPTGCISAASNAITTIWTNPQPTSPLTNTPGETGISATSAQLTWNDLSTETGYEVWRYRFSSVAPPFDYNFENVALVKVVPANTVSYIDQGLRPQASYRYFIRAIQSGGGATFSPEPTDVAQTLVDTSPPSTPGNLAASNYLSDGSGLTLTWDLATDDDHVYKYEVYNGTSLVTTITSPPLTEGLTPPATTYNVTGLAPNSTNIFSVRAADWTGNYSPFSDGLSVNTQKFVTGLDYRYYEHLSGTFVFLQSFDFNQEPIRIGTTSSFTITGSGTTSADKFIFSFEGYLDVQTPGSYSFTTVSNDGSMLYIDNDKTGYKLVVNNDTQKANGVNVTVTSTPITFSAAGKYPIKVLYSEFTLSSSLTVQWKLPGAGSFVTIPAARLFRLEKTFYYLRTGILGDDPSTTLAWTTNSNGGIGGAIPVTSFTDAQRYFILANRPTVNLTLPWSVTGSGSKVVVGNASSTAVTLNLNASLTGTLEAGKNAVINVGNAALPFPSFGSLDLSSTVNFNVSGSSIIPNGSYGFVNLNNSGTYTLPTGSTIMKGNLTVASGTTAQGTANNLSTVTVGGNITFNNANPNPGATNRYTLKLTGGVPHTVGLSTATDLNLFSLVADGGDAVQFTNLSGHTLSVGGSSGGGLVLRSGASLNLLGANLTVTGNGTINPTNETGFIAMNGGNFNLSTTAPQNSNVFFSTTANQNLVTNFTAAAPTNGRLSVGSQTNISNLVTLTGGELNSNSGALTLVSNALGTARIGPLTNGARITGSIAAQRYMPMEAPGKIFRYISSPVKGLSVQALQNYMVINGDFTGSSTGGPPGTIPSMFSFTEPNYVYFPPTGGTNLDTLRRGKGYATYIFEPNNPITWVATGTPYQGTIPFALTGGSPSNPNDGWNLLGNPYPSPIQWVGTGTTSAGWPVMSNINPTVYVRHNFGTQYKWYFYRSGIISPGGDLEILTNGIIASGQAFWVMADDVSPAMSIAEPAKYTPNGGTYYRTAPTARTEDTPDVLAIRLSNSSYDDVAYILHDDQGTENYEKRQDAVKQLNSFFSLSTRSKDGISLAINVTPHTFCEKEIKLNIENAAAGSYSMSFFGLETFQRPVTAVLQDNFTGTTTELQAGSTYDFAITTDAASTGAGRFVLTEKPIVLTNAALKTNSVCESNPSVTLLTSQPGVQYQALFNGGVLSDVITSTGTDSLKLTLDRKALGYGTHTVNLIAGFPGCDMSTLDQTINVTVDTMQMPSIAYQSGGFLVASPANADHYQWMLDGTPLQGKTDPKLMDNNGAGNYQVKVSSGACSKVSTPFDVTAVEDVSALVKVYPNPFRDQIVVTLPEKFQGGTATLINPIGQKVQSVSIAPQDSYNVTLNFAGVEAGPYVLSVGKYKFKVIKIN